MARRTDAALQEILSLLPPGWLWRHMRDPSSLFAQSMRPLAAEASRFETLAEQMIEETDPRSASFLLPDYERVLGPDPCLAPAANLDDRRRSVHARWTARGGASRAYFIAYAAALGVPIVIEEFPRVRHGRARFGAARRRPHPAQFHWRVHLPPAALIPARAGTARSGDPRGRIMRQNAVECALRRLAPAHTVVLFSYGDA